MWVIKWLLFLALLFTLGYLFISNSNQSVDINFFGRSFLGVSLYLVVVTSFLVGFAASFLLAGIREFRFHREIRNLKKGIRTKDKEIAELRTLPLRENDAAGQDHLSQEATGGD